MKRARPITHHLRRWNIPARIVEMERAESGEPGRIGSAVELIGYVVIAELIIAALTVLLFGGR